MFSRHKLVRSLRRAGANRNEAERIEREMEGSIKDGITTGEIYRRAFQMVKKENRPAAARYSLKQAMMELGPTGYPFEQIIGRILEREGYKVSYPETVRGRCITHEVDVVAEKDGEKIMVEAKFHNQPGLRTDAKTAMYVRGRFEDLSFVKENGFNKCWLVTNTKFSKDALAYANCAGIQALGWDYPKGRGIEVLITEAGLHPITAITSLSKMEKEELLLKNIVVCEDVIKRSGEVGEIIGGKIERVVEEAKQIIRMES